MVSRDKRWEGWMFSRDKQSVETNSLDGQWRQMGGEVGRSGETNGQSGWLYAGLWYSRWRDTREGLSSTKA